MQGSYLHLALHTGKGNNNPPDNHLLKVSANFVRKETITTEYLRRWQAKVLKQLSVQSGTSTSEHP